MQIPFHPHGVVEQGVALTGIEKDAPSGPFDQGGEAMLPKCPGERTDGIVTEYGDAAVHRESSLLIMISKYGPGFK
jgi:hypothetical protein